MKLKSMAAAGALALLALPAHAAVLVNAGFETGDLSDWTVANGPVEVITEADDAIATPPFGEHFTATAGTYFARLTAGDEAEVYTLLSQAFSISDPSFLSGDAAFLAFDYLPYDDDAFVRVYSASTNEVVFASSVAAVGDYGHTSWIPFSTGTLTAGDYVLEAGVRDRVEAGYSSQLLVDNFTLTAVTTAVPEPASWALMIGGFSLAGALLRRRRHEVFLDF